MRRFPALLGAVALVAAALAGCTAAADGGCAPSYASGDASDTITAPGKVAAVGTAGKAPKVEFPTPLVVTKSQASTIVAGTGAPIATGSQLDYDFSIYIGATGEQLSATSYDGTTYQRVASGVKGNSLSIALECAKVGERLALATTVGDVKGAFQEGAFEQSNVKDDASIVLVVDVAAAYLGKADGFNQLPKDGMPTVVTAVDGRPAISVGLVSPPKKTESSVIKAGSGATLKADDNAVLQFSSWVWPSGGGEPTTFSSTWDAHQAVTLAMTRSGGAGLPVGIVDGLIGQKVGSQVLVVLAPGDDSFDPANLPTGVEADSTVIFVFDIVGVQK